MTNRSKDENALAGTPSSASGLSWRVFFERLGSGALHDTRVHPQQRDDDDRPSVAEPVSAEFR